MHVNRWCQNIDLLHHFYWRVNDFNLCSVCCISVNTCMFKSKACNLWSGISEQISAMTPLGRRWVMTHVTCYPTLCLYLKWWTFINSSESRECHHNFSYLHIDSLHTRARYNVVYMYMYVFWWMVLVQCAIPTVTLSNAWLLSLSLSLSQSHLNWRWTFLSDMLHTWLGKGPQGLPRPPVCGPFISHKLIHIITVIYEGDLCVSCDSHMTGNRMANVLNTVRI